MELAVKTQQTSIKMHQTNNTPKKSERKPAYSSIEDVTFTQQELEALLNKPPRNELFQRLTTLEAGKALKMDGDFIRIRTAVAAFNSKAKKQNKHFRTLAGKDKIFVFRDK